MGQDCKFCGTPHWLFYIDKADNEIKCIECLPAVEPQKKLEEKVDRLVATN